MTLLRGRPWISVTFAWKAGSRSISRGRRAPEVMTLDLQPSANTLPRTAGLAEYGVSSGYCEAVDCSVYCGTVMDYTANLADASPAQLDAGAVLSVENPVVSMTQEQAGAGFYYGFFRTPADTFGVTSPIRWPVPVEQASARFTATDVTGVPTAFLTGINNAQNVPRRATLRCNGPAATPRCRMAR